MVRRFDGRCRYLWLSEVEAAASPDETFLAGPDPAIEQLVIEGVE